MSDAIYFDSWAGLLRILIIGFTAYVTLVVMLRLSGKRTLSKMNAFDLIVTVALGSVLAAVILNRAIPLAEGVLALALLIFFQFVITYFSVPNDRFERLLKSEPTLLVHEGRYLDTALKRQRVTRDEVGAALRAQGKLSVVEVRSVVLETDGTMTVVPQS